MAGGLKYYLYDPRNTVTALTDPSGEIVERYRYDAFGGLFTGVTAPYNTNGLTGHEFDPVAGLIDMNARWFAPDTGRFLTPDRWSGSLTLPWTQNRYAYAGNNPYDWEEIYKYLRERSVLDMEYNLIYTAPNAYETYRETWSSSQTVFDPHTQASKVPYADGNRFANSKPPPKENVTVSVWEGDKGWRVLDDLDPTKGKPGPFAQAPTYSGRPPVVDEAAFTSAKTAAIGRRASHRLDTSPWPIVSTGTALSLPPKEGSLVATSTQAPSRFRTALGWLFDRSERPGSDAPLVLRCRFGVE
jgi:RHS repeat-associated protein